MVKTGCTEVTKQLIFTFCVCFNTLTNYLDCVMSKVGMIVNYEVQILRKVAFLFKVAIVWKVAIFCKVAIVFKVVVVYKVAIFCKVAVVLR